MKNDTMPSLEEIKKGRSNQTVYMTFCDLFLCQVVCKSKWNRVFKLTKLTEVATRSDEAFGLLVLDNNYARAKHWATEELAGTAKETIQKGQPATKWTKEGGNAQVGKGWTDASLIEMATLCDTVGKDRMILGKEFNKHFMTVKQAEAGTGQNKRKSLPGSVETDEQKKKRTVPDDFDDDDNDSIDDKDDNDSTE